MAKQTDTPVIVNRKAKYEYTLVDEFDCQVSIALRLQERGVDKCLCLKNGQL